MNQTAFHLSCASAFALTISLNSAAQAQQAPATTQQTVQVASTAAPSADAAAMPDEIIVTALRRSQNILKAPATISVLNGADIRALGVVSVSDLPNQMVGVNIGKGPFGTAISIRGVTSTDQTSKGEMGIAFNIDGAFIGRGQEQGVAFFDLERIEVLKGPQGTLYGRSATGGAINVITRKPVLDKLSGNANLEFGNYNTKRGEAAINVPLNSKFALRVAGSFNDRDGYLNPTNITVVGSPQANNGAGPTSADLIANGLPSKNDQNDTTGRLSLLFQPSDDFTALLIGTAGHIGGVGVGETSLDNFNKGGSAVFQIVPNYVPSFVDVDFTNANLQLNGKFGEVQVDVMGNLQHFNDHSQQTNNRNPFNTGNPTAAGAFALQDYQGVFDTSQLEARISNVNPGLIEYVAGANYYYEKINESDHNWLAPLTATGGLSSTSEWVNAIDPVNTTDHKSYGVFGQATVNASDKFAVVVGLRYTHDESTRVGTFSLGPVPGCTYPNDCIGGLNNGNASDQKVTYKLGLNYQATPTDLFYGSIATGFKPGGFNDFDPVTNTAAPYGPEQLTAFELGYKGRPMTGLTLTATAYYYDYSQKQINGLVLFPTSSGVIGVLYTQLAPIEMYGIEAEANYQIGRSTTVNVSAAYEHSRIVSLQTGFLGYLTGVFADFSGYPLPNTPEFVAIASANHAIDLNNGGQVRLRAALKVSSGYDLTDFANAVVYKQSSFSRGDASVTYAAPDDHYSVQLFVENIGNTLQRTNGPTGYNGVYGGFTGQKPSPEIDGTAFPTNSVTFGTSTPRFFGVRLGVNF